ncbi:sugar transferase [Phenylobacterium sp.]|uniref:sugar transferase n=1 Tax=Phenylobacterium sp. TaxID=1871053 RepID=UPI0025F423E4|nr:sugar transferase [Phenylobacterium sp.]MBX3486148.1 sugar transferase [Phenylobacterium sp.]MCW5760950.1 sugar transferase [Phenylobacterium sp.]
MAERAPGEGQGWATNTARPAATAASTASPAPAKPAKPVVAKVARSFRKRAFDIVMSLGAILFFLPLLISVALLVRSETPGPALFKQRRTGLNGRIFTVYKFRTMTVTEDGAVVRQATREDARVTAWGGMLRKYSIDELPQLFNVLKGDMSLIGPRPHAVAHDEAWGESVPGYNDRFRAKPGLTGYAAISGFRGEVRDHQAIVDRVASDNEYIDTWSFGLDIKIVLKTIPLVFADERAY